MTGKQIHTESKRLPKNTRLTSTNAEVKRVRVNEFIGELLSEIASELNKKFTQGIVAYEYLLMERDDISDPIDDMEQLVDNNLSDFNVDPESINKISYENTFDKRKQFEGQKRRNIWIPRDINNNWDSINDKLEEAIIKGYNSIYSDRLHRINVKKDLLKLIKSNGELSVESKEAKNIYQNNVDEYDVPTELKSNYDINIESKIDYDKVAGNMNRWNNRFEVLDDLLDNQTYEFHEIVDFIKDSHNIESRTYVKRKIREFSRLYGHSYLIDSSVFEQDRLANVNSENYYKIYELYDYTMQEVLYALADQNNGKIARSKIQSSWSLDTRIKEFVQECDKIVFAHKSKNIHTKEQYEKLRQK